MRSRRVLRIVVELLVFLLLTAATVVLLRPLQTDVLRKMAALRDSYLLRAESALGRRVEYRSMGPSLFRSVDLRDVRVVGLDGGTLLSLNRLRIEYSLIGLLRGEGLGSVRGLLLDRPTVSLDLERDADLLARFKGSDSTSPLALSPEVRVRVRGGSVRVSSGERGTSAENLSLEVRSRDGRLAVDAHAEVEHRDARSFPGFDQISAELILKGEVSSDFSHSSLSLTIPRFRTPVLSVSRQTVLVSYSGGVWDILKAKDREPFDLRCRIDAKAASANVSLVMEDYVPGRSVETLGAWKAYDPWLSSRFTGRVELDASAKGAPSGRFELVGTAAASTPVPGAVVGLSGMIDSSAIRLAAASFRSRSGTVSFAGHVALPSLIPEGTLKLESLRVSDQASIDAVFNLEARDGALSLYADSVGLGAFRLDSVDALVRVDRKALSFSVSAYRFGAEEEGGYGNVRTSRLDADGSFTFSPAFLQASLSFDSFSASDALTALRPFLKDARLPERVESVVGSLSFTAEAFITTDLNELSFNVPRLAVASRGEGGVFAVMSVSGTKTRLDLRDAVVSWRTGSAGGSLSLDFADPSDIAFSAQASYRDSGYSVEGLLLDGRNLSFRGDYGLTGNFMFSPDAGLSGSVSFDSLPLPVSGFRFFAGAALSIRYAAADAWSATIQRFSLEETTGALRRPLRLSFSGRADQSGASIEGLTLEDEIGRLSGDASADWRKGPSAASVSARLAGPLGDERYEAEVSAGENGLRLRVYGSGARGARFFDDRAKTRATGEVRARWHDVKDYEADFKIAELRTELNAEEYRFSGSGRLTPDVLELEDGKVVFRLGVGTISSASVDRASSTVSLEAAFRGFVMGRDANTSVSAKLELSDFGSWDRAPSALERGTAKLSFGRTEYGTLRIEPFDLTMSKDGAAFSLDGGPQNSLRLRFDSDGAFFAALSAPAPIRGTVVGSIRNGTIDASANNLYLDFASLWSVLNLPEVSFPGGIATGSLTISGPVADPDFFGTASAVGFRATVPAWVDGEIGPVSAPVEFAGKEFSFGPAPANVRGGKGFLSGRFRFDRWVPFDFDLRIDVPGASPIPVKTDVAGISARGFASGKLALVNTIDNFDVSGKLVVENATMTIDAEALAAESNRTFIPEGVTVDLELTTGRKVEFDWPSSDFPVLRGYADAGDSLRIAFDGLTGRYSLIGDIGLRGGEVFYVMRSFYIRDGAIKFGESEVRFDPRLSVLAEIRDRNEEGPVTISLVIDEAPLSTFRPRFESSPPLSQTEILGMLGQNVLGAEGDGSGTQTRNAVLTATSDVLAQFNVVRVFERNTRELLGLDMFSVRTQLIQNAFFGATGLLSEPVDRNAGLGNYFDNTTVYMGKFFGPDIFLQGMVSMQIDETRSKELLGGLSLEPEIDLEWKTPLFLLRWNFAPDFENGARNMFITDHSFTFSWRKSF